MYIPKSFEEQDKNTLYAFIRAHNFAVLFSHDTDGHPIATHLPFMLHDDTLITHMARANPHWKVLTPDNEVLVVFQGAHSYISAAWYETPSVVPTWNYAAVHVTGKPQVIHDADTLKQMVITLTEQHHEATTPALKAAFPDNLLKAIVGIEIPISRIQGAFKFNQNKPRHDQQAVADVLSQSADSVEQAVVTIMHRNLESE